MIEPATVDDLDRVLDLWQRLVEHGREHGLHLHSAANRRLARERLAAAVGDDRVFVARDEEIVGFADCELPPETFEADVTRGVVENVYVLPERRGEGIGTALVEAAERRLADLGAEVVAVETLAADDRVRRFYRRQGYRPQRVVLERRIENHRKDDGGDTE